MRSIEYLSREKPLDRLLELLLLAILSLWSGVGPKSNLSDRFILDPIVDP